MPGVSCPGVTKGRDGKTPFERLHGKRPTQDSSRSERFAGKKVYHRSDEQDEPRYQYGICLGMRNNSAQCFTGNADGAFRAREIRRLELQGRWDTEAINSVIGVLWRRTDGKWTVDRPEVRVDPIPIPPLPCEGARIQRERESPGKSLMSSEPRLDAQAAMPPGTTEKHKHTQIAAECESKSASEPLRVEQKGWVEEMR